MTTYLMMMLLFGQHIASAFATKLLILTQLIQALKSYQS